MKAVSCPIFQRTCAPICHFGIEFRFFTSDRNEVEQETRRGRPGALVMSVGAVNWAVVLVVAPVVCLFVFLLFALSSSCWYWPKVPGSIAESVSNVTCGNFNARSSANTNSNVYTKSQGLAKLSDLYAATRMRQGKHLR